MPVRLLDHGAEVANGADAVRRAADRLRAGDVVAIPTDTVYGLAAAFDQPGALTGVFRIKGRPDNRTLPILVNGAGAIAPLIDPEAAASPSARRLLCLADRFWPGGLTVALPARSDLPAAVREPDGTAGFRVPADRIARQLLGLAGGALAVTSANRSGEPTPSDPRQIASSLGDGPDSLIWVLADGERPGNAPSTVVGLGANGRLIIHRHGTIPAEVILSAWHTVR